jgi:hypothetical protein
VERRRHGVANIGRVGDLLTCFVDIRVVQGNPTPQRFVVEQATAWRKTGRNSSRGFQGLWENKRYKRFQALCSSCLKRIAWLIV